MSLSALGMFQRYFTVSSSQVTSRRLQLLRLATCDLQQTVKSDWPVLKPALQLMFSKTVRVWSVQRSLGQMSSLFDRPGVVRAGLVLILLIAALFRFNGLNWDSDQ